MGRIRVLPEVLAHQIAAGEIVERPASVAKELIENALDAGAARIRVEAEEGGTRRLMVRDDGIGMSAEDARLALQHHATSKIRVVEDLSRITTLGFRGEALPSIASVSRLRLRTVEKNGADPVPEGTEMRVEGGVVQSAQAIAWPAGTEIEVRDLFYNVPARRKFLKTVSTEIGHVSRQVTQYALANPQVEFSFLHQNRTVFEAGPVQTLEERLLQLMGADFIQNLVPLQYEIDDVTLTGFVSLPHEQRNSGNWQYLFVNGRMVRDRVLNHAIRLAYQDLIPAQAYPVAVILLRVDPAQVDVNVHPCKTEIRFRDSNRVHRAIYHGIQAALLRRKTSLGSLAREVLPQSPVVQDGSSPYLERVSRSLDLFHERRTGERHGSQAAAHPGFVPPTFPPARSNVPGAHGQSPETAHLGAAPLILGQFVESFIVAADREGVMVIDQHVAHERILYERALRAMSSGEGCPVQRLLLPVTLELSAEQQAVLHPILDELNRNGFEVAWFGGRTIAIHGMPSLAGSADAAGVIEQILEEAGQLRPEAGAATPIQRLREKIAISLACRAAVKINMPLGREKMQWLIDELFACDNPYTCPHGRPIVLKLGLDEILRNFKRI